MATEQHVFSTGVLLIGAAGNAALTPALTLTVTATGGSYYLQLGNQVTAAIPYGASAAAIQAALNAISNGFGAVVSGAGPFTVQLLTPLFPLSVNTALTVVTGGSVTVSSWTLPKIADVQDINLDITFIDKQVMTSAVESLFGIDVGFGGGKAESKVTVKDFNRTIWTAITNAVKSTAGSVDTFTIASTTSPILFRAEFYGIDTNGKFVYFVGTRVYSKSLSHAFKIEDVADQGFDLNFLADPSATGASGYGTVLTLSMEQ